MKRFTLTKKLKEKATAPIPTEIERPTERREPPFRKWFFRSFLFIIFLGIVYIVFKDLIFVEIKGLVRPEKITVKAPFDGTFIAFASVGDLVEKDHPIGKIYNSKVESEIKSLQETLKLLLSWKERLEEENSLRGKLEELTLSTRTYSLSDLATLRKELQSLYRERGYKDAGKRGQREGRMRPWEAPQRHPKARRRKVGVVLDKVDAFPHRTFSDRDPTGF